jgi:hypothetical protein
MFKFPTDEIRWNRRGWKSAVSLDPGFTLFAEIRPKKDQTNIEIGELKDLAAYLVHQPYPQNSHIQYKSLFLNNFSIL